MLGLPEHVRGCLFDLDGVLTRTAKVHAAAWKATFDEFLRGLGGGPRTPFDEVADYQRYVDGRTRLDGVRTFLAARGVHLPEADARRLGDRKNALFHQILEQRGVEVFDGSVRYVRAVRAAGLHRAVVSASANAGQVLAAAGLAELFEARIDGVVAQERGLAGKPAPDMYLAGAEALGLAPARTAVFEDALAGVAAGRAGGFALVVGVDRTGQADALRAHGADLVVTDLADLLESP